ncbi:hypothetical protein KA005_17565 [bacterium]|nr:hypothetical protein [bacterium]
MSLNREYYKLPEAAQTIGCSPEDLIHHISTTGTPIAILLSHVSVNKYTYVETKFDPTTLGMRDELESQGQGELSGKYYLPESDTKLLEIMHGNKNVQTLHSEKDNSFFRYQVIETNNSTLLSKDNLVIDADEVEKIKSLPSKDLQPQTSCETEKPTKLSNGRKLNQNPQWIKLGDAINKAIEKFPKWESEQKKLLMPKVTTWLREDIGIKNDKAIEVAKSVLSNQYETIWNKRGKGARGLTNPTK